MTDKEKQLGIWLSQIADELNISENTAKTHIKHIYEKLNISNRQDLINLLYKKA